MEALQPRGPRPCRGRRRPAPPAIESLEGQLAKAQARNDAAAVRKAEEAIEARRSWLVEAERTLAEFSG